MAAVAEDTVPTMHRGLSNWWTEETEYVFQRIERWAAFARGYNRLRSQRYSRGRLTMTEEPVEPGWNISANKLVVDECDSWNPRFHNLQRSRRRKSRPEEARINCCGTFNYQSNNKLDSPCLETYRYDHSIYFKTIGDIRGSDRNRKCSLRRSESPAANSSESPDTSDHEEPLEFRGPEKTIAEIECHRYDDEDDENDDNELDTDVYEFLRQDAEAEGVEESSGFGGTDLLHLQDLNDKQKLKSSRTTQVWPIVDLTQLNLKTNENILDSVEKEIYSNHTFDEKNHLKDEANRDNNENNIVNNNNNDNKRNFCDKSINQTNCGTFTILDNFDGTTTERKLDHHLLSLRKLQAGSKRLGSI
ncbi:uncharacterized protein LOC105686091 [Athalia rosae]|uniref:uncharacterized protein LOC105686091 n=1 Tax=Athalia rosae TaxID=37344 RepID=UPI0020334549|nr:uncharacterized protein LOC105686091 [Athalia rosae]